MALRSAWWYSFVLACTTLPTFTASAKPCITTNDASRFLNKDVCISAHVYDVVQTPNGTRFLDTCPPNTADENCRFTIESLSEDRKEVGELDHYRNTDVQIRGTIQPMHGRVGIVLNHARQFYGGPPRFRPNPHLLRGFDVEQSKPSVSDPNLRSQGGRRAFMNTRDQQLTPAK